MLEERDRLIYANIVDLLDLNDTPLAGSVQRAVSVCTPSGSTTDSVSTTSRVSGKRSSDFHLKENAFATPLMALSKLRCTKSCEYDGLCMCRTSLSAIFALRLSFWGEENAPPPTSGQRRESILNILRDAYSINEKKLTFSVTDEHASGGHIIVCELAFLQIVGLTVKSTLHEAPRQWRRCVASIRLGCVQSKDEYKLTDKPKFSNALGYIRYITDKIAETTPYGLSDGPQVKIVPYEDVRQFFSEYTTHCTSVNVDRTERALEATFRKALLSMPHIRLIGCKGSFHTCELCNNANELLRDPTKRFTREQRDVFQRYKHIHLKQQQRERETLEENKHLCTEMDANGNVKCALFAIGMCSIC